MTEKHPERHDQWMIRRKKARGIRSAYQPSCFFTPDLRSLPLAGIQQGQTAFLVCGGPSATPEVLDGVCAVPGAFIMAINNIVERLNRVDAWIGVDEPKRFLDRIWHDPTILKFYPLAYSENKLANQDIRPVDCPNMVFMRRNDAFDADTWCDEETINWGLEGSKTVAGGHSTMMAALRVLQVLGFSRIYLIGADFNMTVEKGYAHSQQVDQLHADKNNQLFRFLNRSFTKLRPHLERRGVRVFNCNPESKLTAFPTCELPEVLQELDTTWANRLQQSSAGLYDKHYKPEVAMKKSVRANTRTRPTLSPYGERVRLYISYTTPNLGDDVQTLACIAQHEQTLDLDLDKLSYIDRDNPVVQGEAHRYTLDVNCWYGLASQPVGFPGAIEQELTSVHLRYTNGQVPNGVLQWLKSNSPVGCRDRYSEWLCHQYGIEATLVPCPTLRLRRSHLPALTEPIEPLVIVDAAVDLPGVERDTHQLTAEQRALPPAQRMALARSKLIRYAQSKGVITSRIHCAYPCIGMGVPVYFVPDGRDISRFGGYEALLDHARRQFVDSTGLDPLGLVKS